jgi:hypothetical protein
MACRSRVIRTPSTWRQFFSMNDRIAAGEILKVSGSISTKSGVAPTRAIQAAVAKNE